MKLSTINLIVSDPQKTKQFYIDALGLKENARRSDPPHFFYLESEGAALTIGQPHQGDAPQPTASFEIGFEVADLKIARQKLESAGVRDLKEESMHWGDAIETHDPDGHRIVV